MGRAPCCEKMGLKRGPWTPQEDQILIDHIRLYGHSNWRALPKQAGLLRCGKSCRLRWINYLRPDIKRGNFTREEEETIIKLHETLGNRWSAIAAKLPGRTDNEIKNVWHTHLKKRINKQNNNNVGDSKDDEINSTLHDNTLQQLHKGQKPASPQQSTSSNTTDTSTVTTLDNVDDVVFTYNSDSALQEDFPMLVDVSFLPEIVSVDNYISFTMDNNVSDEDKEKNIEILERPLQVDYDGIGNGNSKSSYSKLYNDDVEFWFGLLTGAGELSDIPEF